MSITVTNRISMTRANTLTPGRNKAAELESLIGRLALGATEQWPRTVFLTEGAYYFEAPVDLASWVHVVGAGRGTIIVPEHNSADADSADDAVLRGIGTLDPDTVSTTIAATAPKGRASIIVTSATGIAAGMELVLEGANVEGQDQGGHSGGTLAEIVKVASSYVSGTTIPLAWPLYQTHSATAVTVKCVRSVLGAEVRDLQIVGSDGVLTSAGVHFKYARRVAAHGITASGCSRAAIDAEACVGFASSGFYNLGGSNGWYGLRSVLDLDVWGADGAEGVDRSHAQGKPRAQIYVSRRSTGDVYECNLVGGYAGFFQAGGQTVRFSDIRIRNQEITQALYDRAVAGGEFQDGGTWALGWGSGHGPLEIAEFAFGSTYSNITTEDLRAPDATGWNDVAPRRAMAVYIHDTKHVHAENISCMHWDGSASVGGVLLSDTDGHLDSLIVKGHDFGLAVENFNDDLKVSKYRFDAVRATSPNAVIPLYLDYDASSNRGLRIEGMHTSNANSLVWFGGGYVYDPYFKIDDLVTDQGEWSHVVLADNQSGTAFAAGDVVEIDSTHTGADIRIVTPNTSGTDYASRLVAVASGAVEDVGTGPLLVCPLPATRASVKASAAAVAFGDRIGYAATRRAATAAGAAQPIGKALTRKAAGSEGMIRLGSVA